MRIAIIGGHGKVALLLAPKLVAYDNEVTSIIRNPDQTDEVAATGATPKVADIENLSREEFKDLLQGVDAVVWSAGAGGGSAERTTAVDRDAAIRSMDAAEQVGVQRYVMVSYFGAGTPDKPHGVPTDNAFFAYAQAKTEADDHLRGSKLNWTIVKPSMLTTTSSTGTLNPHPTDNGDTARDLVADVIQAVLDAPIEQVAGKEIAFTNGDVPLAQAIKEL